MKNLKQMKKGFTLMETLLAMALVATLVSIFLTVFVPSRRMVQEAITKQDAERVAGILKAEVATLRTSDRKLYKTSFDKGFSWLQKTSHPSSSIVVFSYRADMSGAQKADGTYPAVLPGKQTKLANTQILTVACPVDDPLHKDDIRFSVGPAFLVKMTQLTPNNRGEMVLAPKPGVIQGASSPDQYCSDANSKTPFGAVIFYRADFYLMSPPNPDRYKGRSWDTLGRPVFSSNLSFTR